MDIAATIMSVALTAAIVVPLVIAVVFIRQLRDIARSGGAERSTASSRSGRTEPADPDDDLVEPDEESDRPHRPGDRSS